MTRRLPWFVLIGVLLIWLGGFAYFFGHVPRQRAPENARTDAIVVFTGLENMRIRQGLESFRAGVAPRLLISGVDPSVNKARLVRWLYSHPPGDLKLDFTLGYQAANTVGNAEETAAWACANNVHSVLLITSDYHMQRALFLLRRAWPDAMVTPDPLLAPYGHRQKPLLYRVWRVWQSFIEYHKLTIQHLRTVLGLLDVPAYHCVPVHESDMGDD